MISRESAKKLKQDSKDIDPRSVRIVNDFLQQLNDFYNREIEYTDLEIQELMKLQKMNEPPKNFYNIPTVRASSASHCPLELFLLNQGGKGHTRSELLPYHRRWLRNAHAVHEAMQRDLLYMEKELFEPKFTVARKHGLPAWEETIRSYRVIEHGGEIFGIEGMMDGILKYSEGMMGFEFKTKSTTVGVIGRFKMKGPIESHVEQLTAYSLLFGLNDFILMYESLAKDAWKKGELAKEDIRVFHVHIDQDQRNKLLNKLAMVAHCVNTSTPPPPEYDKCLFCSMKDICEHYKSNEIVEEYDDGVDRSEQLKDIDLGGLIDG